MPALSTPSPPTGTRERLTAAVWQALEHRAPVGLRAFHRRTDCVGLQAEVIDRRAQRSRGSFHAQAGRLAETMEQLGWWGHCRPPKVSVDRER